MVDRFIVVALLLAHAAIHGGFLSPRPPATPDGPSWPFRLERPIVLRDMLDPRVARLLGTALVAVTVAGFALAALAALGFLPDGVWVAAVAIGSIASLALLVLFYHRWLTIGIVTDLVLLFVVLVQGWVPSSLGS